VLLNERSNALGSVPNIIALDMIIELDEMCLIGVQGIFFIPNLGPKFCLVLDPTPLDFSAHNVV
jgi:hypothetical protein